MPDPGFQPACPLPAPPAGRILMAHGGGGRMTGHLLRDIFLPAFANPHLLALHDGARLPAPAGALAFTTDGFVVTPPFFPGGDIGMLAVHGTVNDLAMCAARPLWLSAAFILEEGFPVAALRRIVDSIGSAAAAAGVQVVTGDTKVVERGHGDGIYICTAGIGVTLTPEPVDPSRVTPGDAIILSGDIGRHGLAVLACREGLQLESTLQSDCAPLHTLVESLVTGGVTLHCLRDLTRGGLGAALNEIAAAAGVTLEIDEAAIPISDAVHGACELLGIDPLFAANEGRMILFTPAAEAQSALSILRDHPFAAAACQIGTVLPRNPAGQVIAVSAWSTRRIIDLPAGEQLPRIC